MSSTARTRSSGVAALRTTLNAYLRVFPASGLLKSTRTRPALTAVTVPRFPPMWTSIPASGVISCRRNSRSVRSSTSRGSRPPAPFSGGIRTSFASPTFAARIAASSRFGARLEREGRPRLLRHPDRDRDPLVPVPDRDLRDDGHVRDLLLGTRLRGQDRGDVDRRRGDAARRDPGGELVLLDLVEDLLRLPLDVHVQFQPVAEARDVVPRALGQQAESELPDQRPVRAANRFAVDRRLRSDLVEGPRHAALAARGVQGRGDDLVDRAAADEVLR